MKKVLSIALLSTLFISFLTANVEAADTETAATTITTKVESGGLLINIPATLDYGNIAIGSVGFKNQDLNFDVTNLTGSKGTTVTLADTTATDVTGVSLQYRDKAVAGTTFYGLTATPSSIFTSSTPNTTKVIKNLEMKVIIPTTVKKGTSARNLSWVISPNP